MQPKKVIRQKGVMERTTISPDGEHSYGLKPHAAVPIIPIMPGTIFQALKAVDLIPRSYRQLSPDTSQGFPLRS